MDTRLYVWDVEMFLVGVRDYGMGFWGGEDKGGRYLMGGGEMGEGEWEDGGEMDGGWRWR